MKFKETETLPDHTLDIQPITYKQVVSDGFSPTGQSTQELTGGRILGVDYSNQGLSEQQMVDRLDKYVIAHNGTLLGVQFDPSDVSAGFFIVKDNTTSVVTRYDFRINTHLNTVSVVGPQPWQV
jgi:hypothetical protein